MTVKPRKVPAGKSGQGAIADYIQIDIILPKPLQWLGDSRQRLGDFPVVARRRAGFELWEVQQGNEPSDWKPMPSVGQGVNEVRIRADGTWRVLYVAKFAEAVYVLHAFGKKSQQTPKPDIDLAAGRYGELLKRRALEQRRKKEQRS
jgi:phage-related protein